MSIGPLELLALGYAQASQRSLLEPGELARALGVTRAQERKLLHHLNRKQLIVRVRRGLYLVPSRLPAGGRWSPTEALAIDSLMRDCGGTYQICGPNAFFRYGWIDQVPNRVCLYNNRISGDRQIGSIALTLIKVADARLGEVERIRTPEAVDAVYSSRVRSLVDAVYDWARFDSLPRAFDWMRGELQREEGLAAQLVKTTLRFGNQATIRRIGAHAERIGVSEYLLRKLERALYPSSSFIPWIPGRPKRGAINKRWGVVFNDK